MGFGLSIVAGKGLGAGEIYFLACEKNLQNGFVGLSYLVPGPGGDASIMCHFLSLKLSLQRLAPSPGHVS